MNAKANQIINRNIYWKIRELMADQFSNWTFGTDYDIMSAYPSSADEVPAYPCFTIMTQTINNLPYEIGSRDRVLFPTEIVIFSRDIAQRDYLNFYIYDGLQNRDFVLYDMSSSEPSVAGDYSGLSTLGKYRCYSGRCFNFPVAIKTADNKLRYESDVNITIECPVF